MATNVLNIPKQRQISSLYDFTAAANVWRRLSGLGRVESLGSFSVWANCADAPSSGILSAGGVLAVLV